MKYQKTGINIILLSFALTGCSSIPSTQSQTERKTQQIIVRTSNIHDQFPVSPKNAAHKISSKPKEFVKKNIKAVRTASNNKHRSTKNNSRKKIKNQDIVNYSHCLQISADLYSRKNYSEHVIVRKSLAACKNQLQKFKTDMYKYSLIDLSPYLAKIAASDSSLYLSESAPAYIKHQVKLTKIKKPNLYTESYHHQ
ncbi:MAG: hypothetical protein KGI54_07330 [Pseudomonadota bacterium]|nr:hypothetical protein [Pseudomonadota bacterium]